MNESLPKEISPGIILFEMSKMMLDHEKRLTAIERTVKEHIEKIKDLRSNIQQNRNNIQKVKRSMNLLGGK